MLSSLSLGARRRVAGLKLSSRYPSSYSSLSSSSPIVASLQPDNDVRGADPLKLLAVGAAAALTAFGLAESFSHEKTECAGIVGVVSAANVEPPSSAVDTRDFLLAGLKALGARGIDGAGVVTVDPKTKTLQRSQRIVVPSGDPVNGTLERLVGSHFQRRFNTGSASRADESVPTPPSALTAVGHTRWATHGSNSNEKNVHPHLDSSGKIAMVHNGSLVNSSELREELKGLGYVLQGQTDSEVLAKLIGHYYYGGVLASSTKIPEAKCSLREATRRALDRCEGTWGLCAVTADSPNELVVACHGSPLFVGMAPDGSSQAFVSSEKDILSEYAPTYIRLDEGEIGVLTGGGRGIGTLVDLSGTEESKMEMKEDVEASPAPHDHWTIKEILEQPAAIGRSLGFGARLGWDRVHLGGLDSSKDLSKVQHIILAGCGSSLNASKYGERIMKHIKAVSGRVTSLDAVEADDDDLYCSSPSLSLGYQGESKDDGNKPNPASIAVLGVTQSGETSDVLRLMDLAMNEISLPVIGITNTVGSSVARMTKQGVYTHAGRENGVASTKSFTSQVAILALVSIWFREMSDRNAGKPTSLEATRLRESLMRLPITFGMALKTRDQCRKIAERLKDKEHCFVLGKGFAEPIAYEGALKIKEMSYLHAEGYSGGALKHGPFALIEDETGKFGATPIIMFILDDQHAHHMRTAAEEVKARGAELIIITDKPSLAHDLDDNPIVIPHNGPMTALGAIIPMQFLAYELAILRGHNPDTPRNLTKIL